MVPAYPALIHAFIWCAGQKVGGLQHDCDPQSAPHRVLVCVLKRHTIATIYAELVRLADQRCPGDEPAAPATVQAGSTEGCESITWIDDPSPRVRRLA